MSQLISGNSIAKLCDHIFSQTAVDTTSTSGYRIVKNPWVINNLKSNQSVFVKTDYLEEFFLLAQATKNIDNITIVTHDSDRVIDQNITNKIPPCVKRMFSINACVIDSRVIPIPIGIANDYCKITFKPQIQKNVNVVGTKALIACNVKNNPTERTPLYSHKFDEEVTVIRNMISLNDYESILNQHDFVFCPEGNGPDTHRIWETLYMGKIPIVKIADWNRSFRDLPILFVDSLLEATESIRLSFVESKLAYQKMDKSTLGYWKNML
ncbi:MAG: hypothetical protein EBZ49_01625 [Proteobacteria bacterium]|nr:hypothetical protein [Pseudomonadota bacterium]